MLPRLFFLVAFLRVGFATFAQQPSAVQLLTTRDSVSLRGLSAPTDSVVWTSGSRGAVGRSLDGGRTWQWRQVPGYEARDFRDVEAFDANTALLMAVAEPARILKTTDGGQTWAVVFADSTKGMFLDAMHFRDDRHGIVVGDPIGGHFFVRGTDDGGNTWRVTYPALAAQPGEACFAASGTNVLLLANGSYQVVTGGKVSRLTGSHADQPLPLVQGAASSGAFSVAARGNKRVVVGGDYARAEEPRGTCALSADGGAIWTLPAGSPRGYRSCVIYLNGNELLSCGPSGVDRSRDGGRRWEPVSPEGFHAAARARKGRVVYLAGAGGRVARLVAAPGR
ncbi:MAG TPA: hypothetical protein VF646_18950 [Cytophagales bacterium]